MFSIDTLEYSADFRKVKFTKAQADELASKMKKSQEDSIGNLATKNELKLTEESLKSRIISIDNKIDNIEKTLRSQIKAIDSKLDNVEKTLRSEINYVVNRAIIKLVIAIPAIMTAFNYILKLS